MNMQYTRLFKAWLIFYKKMILPSLVTALLLAVLYLPVNKIVQGAALAYIPLSLFYQYIFMIIAEKMNICFIII